MKPFFYFLFLLLAWSPLYAQFPTLQWSRIFGGSGQNTTYEVKITRQNHALACGSYSAVMNLGTGQLMNEGGSDGYAARFDENGQTLWAKRLSGTGEEVIESISEDRQGNILLAGRYASAASLDGTNLPYTNGSEGFLAKMDANGNLLWVQTAANPGNMTWHRIVADSTGNVVVFGQFTEALSLGSQAFTGNTFDDLVLAKYSSAGDLLWARSWSATLKTNAYGLSVGPDNQLALSADFQGTITFGNNGHTSQGLNDGLVMLVDSSGNPVWSQSAGSAGVDNPFCVEADAQGNIFLAGSFSGTVNLGAFDMVSNGLWDVFVLKLSPIGTPIWAATFGGPNNDRCNAVKLGPGGDVFLHGWYQDSLTVANQQLQSLGMFDAFLAHVDSSGQIQQVLSFGSTNQDVGSALDVDAQGRVLMGGSFFGSSFAFGNQSFTATTGTSHYLLRTGPLTTSNRNVDFQPAPTRFRYSGSGQITVVTQQAGRQQIFDAQGRTVSDIWLKEGQTQMLQLAPGIYRSRWIGEKGAVYRQSLWVY